MAHAETKLRDAEARRMDAEAKNRAEYTRIMLANLSNMDDDTRDWFMKKHAETFKLFSKKIEEKKKNRPLEPSPTQTDA
jgi:hypothetical protein